MTLNEFVSYQSEYDNDWEMENQEDKESTSSDDEWRSVNEVETLIKQEDLKNDIESFIMEEDSDVQNGFEKLHEADYLEIKMKQEEEEEERTETFEITRDNTELKSFFKDNTNCVMAITEDNDFKSFLETVATAMCVRHYDDWAAEVEARLRNIGINNVREILDTRYPIASINPTGPFDSLTNKTNDLSRDHGI